MYLLYITLVTSCYTTSRLESFIYVTSPLPLQKYLQQLWNTVVLVALLLCTGVIVQARWQYHENQLNDESEVRDSSVRRDREGGDDGLVFPHQVTLVWEG